MQCSSSSLHDCGSSLWPHLCVLQDCLRRHPEVLDDLHKADEGLALSSAAR
jgi:hypothetical protein